MLWPCMIGLMVVLFTFFSHGMVMSMVLLLWGVDAILGNEDGISEQNYFLLLQRNKISEEAYCRDLI